MRKFWPIGLALEPYTDEELAHIVEQVGLEIPQFNRRRAMRALEIAHFGQDLENQESLYEPLIICLDDERSQLYETYQSPSGPDV